MTQHPSLQDNGASGGPPARGKRLRLAIGVALGLALAAGVAADLWLRSETHQVESTGSALIGGPFSLVDPAGKPVTDRDFRGRYMLIYFGYTHCPDVCPITLAKVAAALQMLGPRADHVQPIFITVDPRRDTPEVIGRYATQFSPRILGLTGSPAQIAAVERAYKVYASAESTPAQLDAAIDHTSILYLMGPDGRFIAPVRIDGSPAEVATDVARRL
jgi:protein SCO1/2